MGGGVPDGETWPQYLQDNLRNLLPKNKRIYVYNFGQPAYISSQEVAFFENLLRDGFVPDVAIFLDGLNDNIIWNGIPVWTPWLTDAAERLQDQWTKDSMSYHLKRTLELTPLYRVVQELTRPKIEANPFPTIDPSATDYNDQKLISATYKRYKNNRKIAEALGAHFGVKTVFAWQPIPYFRYPGETMVMELLERIPRNHATVLRAKQAYKVMEPDLRKDFAAQPTYVWCADRQQKIKAMLYVDHAHYNADGARVVADCLEDALINRSLIETQ
jgi:lysophospholipase L1-like esterase